MNFLLSILFVFLLAFPAYGQDVESRIKDLEDSLNEQQRTIAELKAQKGQAATDGQTATKPSGGLFGASALANPNISLILNTFFYNSNLSSSELEGWTIPGYINEGAAAAKGFNLESAELFIFAPVDSYFNLYATMPVAEDGVELEEAYFITTSLPDGIQVKGGKFKSGFGRINGQHPHQWDFADSPLVYKALIGEEGIIEKGVQLTWLPALPFYTVLGAEVLQGDNEFLFGSDAKSGPHAYAAFARLSFDVTDSSTILFGPSIATGKTKTGTIAEDTEFAGDSTLYGLEFTYKWNPSRNRGIVLQSEYLLRKQDGDLTDAITATTEQLERNQDGVYVQALYKSGRWKLGARYDALDLIKDDYILAGAAQDFGSAPWRATAAVEYNPTEFSRVRLQYNHDKASRTDEVNREIYLQFVLGIGAHSAHPF